MKLRLTAAVLAVVGVVVLGFAAPASAHGGSTGTERFLLLQTSPDGPISVSATGPIHAAGKDIPLSDTRDRFVFPKGNLIIDHHPTAQNEQFDPKTCLTKVTESGTYQIVRGTDAYEGASGHGTYNVKVLAQGCNRNKPPKQFLLEIHASGPISLP